MSITLSAAYLAALASDQRQPSTILEVELDSGTVKWGTDKPFSDVLPIVGTVSNHQNKLDPKAGYSTRGQVTFTMTGRDNFKPILRDEYLKGRRVTVKEGFIASGFQYSDYAAVFTGKIVDWSRKGDTLTLVIGDDLVDASKKYPVENATKTQTLDYRNTNPVDIISNILLTRLGMAAGLVDSTQLESERDTWLAGWKFDRVLTEPVQANELLNELQAETNSFLFHAGDKVSFKVFAPPVPGQTIEEYTDEKDIHVDSFTCKSGYKEAFYNRIVVYYDYDESGSDGEPNFESAVIAADAASQGASEWDEVSTKVIKSKWMRSYTYGQPSNVTGVVIYHMSRGNGAGTGTLTYNATNKTLTWTPPNGATVGEAVNVSQDGKYQVFGADKTKYIRVVVTFADLDAGNQFDYIAVTASTGATHAQTLADKLLSRFRNPASIVSFDVDIAKAGFGGVFIKPTDMKDLTTDEAGEKGDLTWTQERVMLTSVRPDMGKGVIHLEAIEARMYHHYCFISPAGTPDYGSASDYEKLYYGFIGDANNMVGGGTADGYYIW